jgi:hypothetical protein
MKGYLFLLLFIFGQADSFFGQDAVIKGKIIDGQTELPVAFASIKIKSKMLGVVTNGNGDFQIPMEYSLQSDSLIISCIGYATKTLSFDELKDSIQNLVRIFPSISSLDEVVVTPKGRGN